MSQYVIAQLEQTRGEVLRSKTQQQRNTALTINKEIMTESKRNNVNNANTTKSKKSKKSSTVNRDNPCSSCPALSTKDKRFVDGEGTY